MSKIIVGVDESDRSKDALALAVRLARRTGAEIELVCAYPYDDHPTGRAGGQQFRRYLREDAENTLALVQEGVADLPALSTRTIADLSPAHALQTIAERDAASLIVIGPSHRGSTGRVLAGTTAERLLHGAPCPVAVAPRDLHLQEPEPIRTIAVGWDGSPESNAALVGATSVARSLGAELRVVEVLDMAWVGTPALMSGPGFIKPPHQVRRDVDARHGLVARARAYDLLVLGTHGHSRAEEILLGSTAALALHACETPVLIARRPPGGRGVADRVVKATHAVAGDRELAEIAARIAARAGGSLTLLHVATPELRPLRRELAQEAVDVLALMATEPVIVTARGHTAEAIVSPAADLDASLVVLGSRGLSGLRALASVSERVGAHAPCSVLVVRGATA